MPSKMEVAPQCIQKLKVGRKMVWIWKLSSFLVFGNFSKIFKKFWILENSREISLLDLDLEAFSFHFSLLEKSESDFYFTFHFSKRVNQIFISLFTSRKEWNRFSFHFSLLELSISTLAGHWYMDFHKKGPGTSTRSGDVPAEGPPNIFLSRPCSHL